MRNFLVLFFAFILSTSVFAQSVKDYKYVIVPTQFEFLKGADQYQLNSLTIFLFNKYGFDAYKNGLETPAYVYDDRCNVLYADVEDQKGLLRTKLKVILRDCNNKIIFTSQEGDSKNKLYKESYHEALREAFLSIEDLNYTYIPKEKVKTDVVVTAIEPADVRSLDVPVVEEVKEEKTEIVETLEVDKNYIEQIAVNEELAKENQVFVSENSSYKLVQAGENFMIFDGTKEIGSAQLDKSNVYIVKTSDFFGEGRFSGDEFLIDREIRGVGIVTMRFVKAN